MNTRTCSAVLGIILWVAACGDGTPDPVEPTNQGPVATGTIPAQTVHVGEATSVDVSSYFSDPDGDALSYGTASSDMGVATVSVSGSMVTAVGVALGRADITVTATDPAGLSAQHSFQVTVPNRAPEAVGSIPDIEVATGDTVVVDVSHYLTDPDGDTLDYEVSSSDAAVVTVAVSGSMVAVVAFAPGQAMVAVTARDPSGLEAEQGFVVTVPNRAPVAVDSLPGLTLIPGAAVKVDLSAHFSDPDGDALVFAGATSNVAVATVSVAQSTLTVTAVGRGETTVTVTASDPGGLEVGQSFRVTVRPNRSPETVGSIPDMRLGSPERLNVSTYFRDPDGDSLIYAVETSEAVIAFGYVRSDTILVIAPVAQGSAMVTVTASDPVGASAQQSLEVTVPNQAPYGVADLTDLAMVVGSTATIDVSDYFADPERRRLSYSARDIFEPGVSVSTVGSVLTVVAVTDERDPRTDPRVVVSARDAGGTVNQYFDVFVASLAPPTNARHERKDSAIVLHWKPSADAIHYNIYHDDFFTECDVRPSGRAYWCDELATGVQDTTYTHTEPDRGANYYWIAACRASECSYVRWVGPPLDGSIAVVGRDHRSLTVRLMSRYADYFELYRSTALSGPYSLVGGRIDTNGQDVIAHVDDGLSGDAIYYYRMKACTDVGCSVHSPPTAGRTEAAGSVAIPPAVTGLWGTAVDIFAGTDDVEIAWDEVPGATYYRVYQDGRREAEITAPRTSYYDKDPNSSVFVLTTTTYQVLACNKSGCSSSAAAVVVR